MTNLRRAARAAAAVAAVAALGACGASGGQIGDILGGVLGGQQQGQQVEATIRSVSANNQQISLQQTNGETVAVGYDQNTKVVYQGQLYAVSNLEFGDRVLARILNNNGSYYTDSIHVTQSVSGSNAGGTTGDVRGFQGTVRSTDRQNGTFVVDLSTGGAYTVSLPYNVGSGDLQRFQNLRAGDTARFYGVALNNSRIELRQFY